MNEQDLPIDIHVGKLVDWLISRRHAKRGWPDNILTIRKKINNAIQDMPEHPEVTKLLTGTYINYYHCLKIVEILKETEKDSKNILGWYGSQRMKDWQEVVRLYEKDNVGLAEAARLLVRNVNFEIPSIKRQIAKGVQIQENCDLKEEELVKGIAASKKRYLQMCKEIGIAGDDIKAEVLGLLKSLPKDFAHIAEVSKSLSPARQLYSDFLSFTISSQHTECLPLLKFVMEHGDVTTYEWLHGEAPCSVEEPEVKVTTLEDNEPGTTDQIDFGDEGIDFGGADDIDIGDDLATGEIDWGNLGEDSSAAIDLGVGVEDGTSLITVEDSGIAGGVASGSEALTVLHNQAVRNQLVDELHELEGFLTQRRFELTREETEFSFDQFLNAPASVQDQSAEQVLGMLEEVKKVLALFSATKIQHLLLITSSPRYVDRLAESLQSKLAVGDKLAETQVAIRKRKQDTAAEQRSIAPQLRLIVDRTRELQHHIVQDISAKYKNRHVNIMGSFL